MQKVIGACMMVAGFTSIGFYRAVLLQKRMTRLRQILKSFSVFETQIDYAVMSLPECFEKIGQTISQKWLSDFYINMANQMRKANDDTFQSIWEKSVEQYLGESAFTKTDMIRIKEIGEMPLYMNKNIQMMMIQGVMKYLGDTIEEIQREYQTKCKIYRVSGLAVGILFMLILI